MASASRRTSRRYNRGMSRAIVVNDMVRVPERALQVRAVRASGPGGQNVNKVATKVDVRVDLDAIEGLSPAARARLETLCRHRLERVRGLVAAALREPRRRKASRPTTAARERRIETKKHRGALKRERARDQD